MEAFAVTENQYVVIKMAVVGFLLHDYKIKLENEVESSCGAENDFRDRKRYLSLRRRMHNFEIFFPKHYVIFIHVHMKITTTFRNSKARPHSLPPYHCCVVLCFDFQSCD